jgi:pimeloyl-ACP methyl ester carboxylesterase
MTPSDNRGQQHEIQLPTGRLRYRERGTGRPIVFVHGYYVNGDLWHSLVDELADEFRCITPDLPLGSHELPMPEAADVSPPGVAAIVADLVEALDLDDVVLVGNDSGGAICQILVTTRPERIGSLVLTPCDAFETFPPFPYNLLGPLNRLPGAVTMNNALLSLKIGRWATFRPLVAGPYDDALVRSWVEPARRNKAIGRDGSRFISSASKSHTLRAASRLNSFEQPVLIAWPPNCRFFKYTLAERLARAFPNAKLATIEDAQTFLALDQPAALANAMRAFVNDRVEPQVSPA